MQVIALRSLTGPHTIKEATVGDNTLAPSDEELARGLQGGDTECFTILVERYQRVVLNVCYRMLGDTDDAQDIAQDVFVKVFQAIDQFDSNRRFFSWLYRITVNTCLQSKRRPTTVALDREGIVDHLPQPDELAELIEQDQELLKALQGLSERERTVIGLRYGAQLSYAEIAATLQVPAGTAKTWLFRAKQRLAHLLRRGE
jgi:RNA polymerase sigma-70 factor (ECF subfamily)